MGIVTSPTTGTLTYHYLGIDELRDQVKRIVRKLEEEHQSLSIELRMCEHDCHVVTLPDADVPGLHRVTKAAKYVGAQRRNRREGVTAELAKREAEILLLRREYADLLAEPSDTATAPPAAAPPAE